MIYCGTALCFAGGSWATFNLVIALLFGTSDKRYSLAPGVVAPLLPAGRSTSEKHVLVQEELEWQLQIPGYGYKKVLD